MNDETEEKPIFAQSFDGRLWAAEFNKRLETLRERAEHRCPCCGGHPVSKVELDEDWLIGWFTNAMMRGFDEHARGTISPTEALYAFAGWLTSRPAGLVVGAPFDAAPMAALVEQYRKRNQWPEVRSDWTQRFSHPVQGEAQSKGGL